MINKSETVGIRIKRLRKEGKMTQMQLADKLRVSRTCVANWESGSRMPNSMLVLKIAKIFSVPADYIYGLTSHKYIAKSANYSELDLSKLNGAGMNMLTEFYKYLITKPEYRAE